MTAELDAVTTTATGMHEKFLDIFIQSQITRIRAIGILLKHVYSARVRADYRLGETFERSHAMTAVGQAKDIISKIDQSA